MDEAQARRRVRELKRFYTSLASYVPVMTGLVLLNAVTSPGSWWVVFPAIGWGIGIAARAVKTFGLFGIGSSEWEEQKVRELTGRTPAQAATQDELARLSSRIEGLATIVTSREWEATSPLVAEAHEALAAAATTSTGAATSAVPPTPPPAPPSSAPLSPLDKERLVALVQHLETLVTSPEFDRLERASTAKREQGSG